jgi:antitoxin (DNA-binding transcriptional repressor) of toxin-antitoxin stability system
MAKPEAVDHFSITVKNVPVADLGPLMALLAKAGFHEIDQNLVTSVARFKQKTQHDVSAHAFLSAWLSKHPTFKTSDAVAACKEDGRTSGSAYTGLRVLREQKVIKSIGPSQWARADVKKLPKQKPGAKKHHDVPAHTFTLREASRNHGRFNSHWLKRKFEADGRHPSGTGPVINRLVKQKQIKRVSDGEYVLLAKATKPAAKVNGAAAEV